MKKTVFFFFLLLVVAACSSSPGQNGTQVNVNVTPGEIKTFLVKADADICTVDDKPVIRYYSTSWCPHCQWIKSRFTKVIQEYVSDGKVVAHAWVLDMADDDFTSVKEGSVPDSEMAIFEEFNPKGSIPTFVFGCKYYRIGNGYEAQNDLDAEEAEFRAVLDKLVADVQVE